jgi:hypothetical protein
VIEGAWRWHRSWRVGRPKQGPASKAVRKEAVCELTGTIEGKRSRDEGEGGIGYFIPSPVGASHFSVPISAQKLCEHFQKCVVSSVKDRPESG